ncbi:Hemin-binding periplasmic protein HmuT [Pseudoalteromonas holothuriae]|uniref:Hemin-binding periplasmic protein HmuT n=1 Tax=Pseudoalteromonas holothuriae TaxID=2963714 RepID=A0A9W4QRU2_9GAMM|nr:MULTISPECIES: ABC transporter substrate-binding protein [unclassified Pseudoalteromonas]CAH9050407.1 Hemin-binding periplasmic protein HmuT [Pseudoalteromonas sp. CIP111854]CAH9068024.1 Hemin-binding periplasmic protein HmuT [Pseudoalteromonas sp. CIP111951]
MKLKLYLFLTLFIHSFSAHAERLVIAGGTLTDIVFALGAGNQVVAVDTSSTWPEQATALPKIGYYRDLAAEGILAQSPTLVLTLEGSGRPEVLTQLRDTGIRLNHYKKPTQVNELFALIKTIGDDLNKQHNATALIKKLTQQLPKPTKTTNLTALYIFSSGDRGVLVAGKETVPDVLLRYTGIKNLATGSGFKPYNLEALLASNPDFIIAPSHNVQSLGGKEAFCKQPSLALLPAAQKCKLLVMDTLISVAMTSRLPEAIAILANYTRNTL